MPFIGAGAIHIALAIFCAVHAMRSGKPMYWLFILFAFPLLGSAAYLLLEFSSSSRMERSARRAVTAVAYTIDPERGVRAARDAYEQTPTAQNRMHLAQALQNAGHAQEAATEYEACLAGPFANDPEILLGAARAYVECERYAEALRVLDTLALERADYRPDDALLLRARSFAGLNRRDEAQGAFETAVARFGTFAARAEHAVWLYGTGQKDAAEPIYRELETIARRWGRQTRELNAAESQRLQQARALALKQV
jgi:hypothetical protein